MKSAPTCLAVLGLASSVAMGGSVLMDQIGLDDGSSIDPANILANQYFEASFSVYDIGVVDDFDNDAGLAGVSMQMVVGGWNGYTGAAGISGLQVNFYTDISNAEASLAGDLTSIDYAGAPVSDPNWQLAGYDLIGVAATAPWNAGVGRVACSMIPVNEFGTNGQTGCAISTIGDLQCWQANPNGGFGFGAIQAVASNAAYRVLGGTGNPCDLPLPASCQADVNGPNGVPDGLVGVDDILMIIETFGQVGNGESRPQGDCAPLPNGDCVVDVNDLLLCIEQFGTDCAPRGACCFGVDGCQEDQTEADCADANGDWLGQGSSCATCVSGACCLSDSGCIQAVPADCQGLGGAYQGDGTTCGDCPALPANNDCSNAIDVGAGGSVAIDNTAATTTGDVIDPCGDADARQIYQDLWYSITADVNGSLVVSTCNATTLDTIVAVYDSCGGTVLGCNDDGVDCTNFTSLLEIGGVSSGDSFIVRIGSFAYGDTASFNGIIEVVPAVVGACCVSNTDCFDLLPDDCDAFGGVYQGGDTDCASISCGWEGCQAGDTPEGVPCQEDTDAAGANADPNGGLNVDPPSYGVISVDETICGSASTFTCFGCADDGTDATFRDTDWYVFSNPEGGTYTVTCGGEGALLFGIVDLNAVAFVATGTTDPFAEASIEVTLPAGDNYCVWVGHDFNSAVLTPCNANLDEYSVTLEGANAPAAACCLGTTCVGDETPADCASLGGSYVAGESCAAGYQCPAAYEPCQTGVGQDPLQPSDTWTAGTSDSSPGYVRYEDIPSTTISSVGLYGLTLFFDGGWGPCTNQDMVFDIGVYNADPVDGFPTSAVSELSSTAANQTAMDLIYAGAYPLKKFDITFSSQPGELLKANSVSPDCWFLWMSSTPAGGGSSVVVVNGVPELGDFDLNYCITP